MMDVVIKGQFIYQNLKIKFNEAFKKTTVRL